jgi:hypothetical protein
MIRITITIEAFEAIARTLPLGSVGDEAEANERGKALAANSVASMLASEGIG